MALKVYFAGSIRGGRVDAELYKRIIQHIGGPAMRPADCDTYLMSLIE